MTSAPSRMRAPLHPWLSSLIAAAAGPVLATAFQPLDWWPAVFLGVGLSLWSLRGVSLGRSMLNGALTAAGFFLIHIAWITVYLGPIPLLALVALETLWYALGALAITFAWRLVEGRTTGSGTRAVIARVVLTPALIAGLWMARESASSIVPWGGFAWGRLAYSQASSPVGDAVGWVGASGLSFLIVFVTGIVLQTILTKRMIVRRRLTIVAIAVIGLVAIPVFPVTTVGELRVGSVQGDAEAGLLAEYTPGEIIDAHAAATEELAGEDLDVLVWPENAGEWNPQNRAATSLLLDRIAGSFDAPLLLGAQYSVGDDTYNAVLDWRAGDGVVDTYFKRHPVPFAEYLPARSFFLPILEFLGFADLIPRDYAIDQTSVNAFDLGDVVAGIAICFDIVDDRLMREMVVEHGAQIILEPTNNADFGEGSAENVQQLAIARLRAMEAGRSLVQISTVGTSAMYLPDGSEVERLPQYEPGVMLASLPLSDTVTSASRFGGWIDAGIAIAAVLALALLTVMDVRRPANARYARLVPRDAVRQRRDAV